MSKLTLEDAISHCLEVAEENEAKAQKIGVQFLGTTKDREATECRECAADHRQLAEWLTELKELREENKVLMQECDRLIKEKSKLLSKVSGGDVLRICQLEEQIKDLKEEYANLNKISYGFYKELKEAKRLLKAAVEDFKWLEQHTEDDYGSCMVKTGNLSCGNCPFNANGVDCKWKHEAEALKLIGGSEND